jgi:hypothetical protein
MALTRRAFVGHSMRRPGDPFLCWHLVSKFAKEPNVFPFTSAGHTRLYCYVCVCAWICA